MTDSQMQPIHITGAEFKGMTYRIDAPAAYQSTKSYGHEMGFSCCFRQWRADSHCRLLHGYALAFKFIFESKTLDVRNWVVDFGGLKPLKAMLQDTFDHTLLVAEDDPKKQVLLDLDRVRGARDHGEFGLPADREPATAVRGLGDVIDHHDGGTGGVGHPAGELSPPLG